MLISGYFFLSNYFAETLAYVTSYLCRDGNTWLIQIDCVNLCFRTRKITSDDKAQTLSTIYNSLNGNNLPLEVAKYTRSSTTSIVTLFFFELNVETKSAISVSNKNNKNFLTNIYCLLTHPCFQSLEHFIQRFRVSLLKVWKLVHSFNPCQ